MSRINHVRGLKNMPYVLGHDRYFANIQSKLHSLKWPLHTFGQQYNNPIFGVTIKPAHFPPVSKPADNVQ